MTKHNVFYFTYESITEVDRWNEVVQSLPNIIWDISEVSTTGATGDPTKASVEKGRQMLDIFVDLVADAIEEMNRLDWDYLGY